MSISIKKKMVTSLVAVALVVCNILPVFAASVGFSKAYVEGNNYTYINRVNKETKYKYVKLSVDTMYMTDNKKASYKKSKAQLRGWNGKEYVRCTIANDYGKTVNKGNAAKFQLLKDYQKAGKTVKYYAKGNNPDIDCKISGTMWVDQEN